MAGLVLLGAVCVLLPAVTCADAVSDARSRDRGGVTESHDGRHLGRDLARGARAFGSDAWAIVSSPARLDRTGAAWLAGVLAIGTVVYVHDEDLHDAAQRNRGRGFYGRIIDVGEFVEPVGFMGDTNPIYMAALGVGYAFEIEPLRTIPAQILESHFIAGGLRNAAKVLVGRRRPFENGDPGTFEFNGGTSFPSGHTSVVFELATIVSHHADSTPVTVLAYALATTVALQRVDASAHWPSDVYAAAVSGTLIARTVVRRHEARALAIAPVSLEGGRGLGLAGTLRF